MAELIELKRDLAEAERQLAEILTGLERKYGGAVEVTTESRAYTYTASDRFVTVELSLQVDSRG